MGPFVLATANPDKVLEISAVLSGVELLPRPSDVPEVVEDGATLEDNARLKAEALVDATGAAAVADDTGLFVDALDGEPGVQSAYYAGPHATYQENVAKLLQEMEGVREDLRTAQFRTLALLRHPDGSELIVEGRVDGSISTEPRGSDGWGFDFVFCPAGSGGRTLAELGFEEKNRVSHRGLAFAALKQRLDLIG